MKRRINAPLIVLHDLFDHFAGKREQLRWNFGP
jgi:hypothetical protein